MSRRRVLTVGALTIAWCALWGEVTVANLASGLVLSGAVVASGAGPAGRGGVRIRPLARFGALVAVDLVVSTLTVARAVLTPSRRSDEAIIAVPLPNESRHHKLLLIVAVTVTPGTAVVDADPDTGTLYLHLLDRGRRAEVERHVRGLAELACAALPAPDPSPAGPKGVHP